MQIRFTNTYDLNLSTENPNLKNLLNSFDLESLIKIIINKFL